MTQVVLLGTETMGYRLAHNLLQAQHELIVYNRIADKLKSLGAQGAIPRCYSSCRPSRHRDWPGHVSDRYRDKSTLVL